MKKHKLYYWSMVISTNFIFKLPQINFLSSIITGTPRYEIEMDSVHKMSNLIASDHAIILKLSNDMNIISLKSRPISLVFLLLISILLTTMISQSFLLKTFK